MSQRKTCHICGMDLPGLTFGVDHWDAPLDKSWRDTIEKEELIKDIPAEAHCDYLAALIKETGNG